MPARACRDAERRVTKPHSHLFNWYAHHLRSGLANDGVAACPDVRHVSLDGHHASAQSKEGTSRRRTFLALTAPLLAWALAPAFAQQSPGRPGRPVRMLVGFPPGGSTDIFARALSDELSKMWAKPVVVENRGGRDSLDCCFPVSGPSKAVPGEPA
jgi:hypothetical protein